MRRKWSCLIGAFLLAAGLLAGCAEESGQPPKETQAVESREMEQTEVPAVETEDSEADEEDTEAFEVQGASETPEAIETSEVPETPEAIETSEVSEAPDDSLKTEILEEGVYTSKEEVAGYLFLYGHLPDNFITKKEAKALGWVSSEGNLGEVAPGKSIGGDYFGNFEGNLPEKEGREYHECDIDSNGGYRGAKRIVYSNDGLIYYTEDHYKTFELLYGEE